MVNSLGKYVVLKMKSVWLKIRLAVLRCEIAVMCFAWWLSGNKEEALKTLAAADLR